MSRLDSFLKVNVKDSERTKDVFVSDRFEAPVTIKLLSPKELSRCQEMSVSIKGKKPYFDSNVYNMEILKTAIVEPDLKDAQLQDSYGVMNEEDLINEMFTGAEFVRLTTLINEFNSLDEGVNEKIDKAKN